jgi:mannose-1-phosphate guanylyltransferase
MPIEGNAVVVDGLLSMFKEAGCDTVFITVSHFSRLLRSYCGDGSRYGLSIEYVEEEEPLGTIGPLRPMRDLLDTTFFVTNSDVYLDLDTKAFLAAHRNGGAYLTVAIYLQVVDIAYGVLDHDDGRVTAFREKPSEEFTVSTGVYLMEPEIIDLIPEGSFGFDELVGRMLSKDIPIGAYLHDGTWIDIGRIEDLRRAQKQAAGLLTEDDQ